METPKSINEWAKSEFGDIPAQYYGRAVERALEELIEAFDELTCPLTNSTQEDIDQIAWEMADVAIVLMRLLGHFKYREDQCVLPDALQEYVDTKMAKNRGRRWTSDGTGHGYHIK